MNIVITLSGNIKQNRYILLDSSYQTFKIALICEAFSTRETSSFYNFS